MSLISIFFSDLQQVDTWTHDLIYKENKAKENSDWLLFMLETITRGIVSLVEVAYLVGEWFCCLDSRPPG